MTDGLEFVAGEGKLVYISGKIEREPSARSLRICGRMSCEVFEHGGVQVVRHYLPIGSECKPDDKESIVGVGRNVDEAVSNFGTSLATLFDLLASFNRMMVPNKGSTIDRQSSYLDSWLEEMEVEEKRVIETRVSLF